MEPWGWELLSGDTEISLCGLMCELQQDVTKWAGAHRKYRSMGRETQLREHGCMAMGRLVGFQTAQEEHANRNLLWCVKC